MRTIGSPLYEESLRAQQGPAGTTAQMQHPLGVENKESKHLVLTRMALESRRCSTKSGLTLEAQAPK